MSYGPASILYDAAGVNPVTATAGSVLGSSQPGLLNLGSDYGSSAALRIPKVDALGNAYNVPMVGSVPVPVAVNVTTTTPQNYYGSISLAWSPTSNQFVPYQVDATGAAVVRNSLAVTAAYAPGTSINTGATSGKSMFSIFNNGTNYLRILAVYLMAPVQSGTSNGLLSSSGYTVVGMGIAKFTTLHTAGTVISPAIYDSRDTLDTNITCRTGATISNQASVFMRVFDAGANGTMGYSHREDPNIKVMTACPGEGFTCQCLSSVGTGGVNFYLSVVVAQNTA